MQHLRGRIAKSDVRTTYHVRTYASSTVSRHFGAETKKLSLHKILLQLGHRSSSSIKEYVVSYEYF